MLELGPGTRRRNDENERIRQKALIKREGRDSRDALLVDGMHRRLRIKTVSYNHMPGQLASVTLGGFVGGVFEMNVPLFQFRRRR